MNENNVVQLFRNRGDVLAEIDTHCVLELLDSAASRVAIAQEILRMTPTEPECWRRGKLESLSPRLRAAYAKLEGGSTVFCLDEVGLAMDEMSAALAMVHELAREGERAT